MSYQVLDHYDTIWGLIIYGTGNEYTGVDTKTAAKNSECSKLFQHITNTSDRSNCYWKGNVTKYFNYFYEEDTFKANKTFRELFFSYSKKMIVVLNKCEKFNTYNEVYKFLSPLKKYLFETYANSQAQFDLASCYSSINMGYHFTSIEDSIKLYHLSADQGFFKAEQKLASIYEFGELNQLQNFNLAFKYYKLAADHLIKDIYKKFDMKPIIDIGSVQHVCLKDAHEHFKMIQRGNIICDKTILLAAARCHEEGIGTMINLKTAVKYYKLVSNAKYNLRDDIIRKVAEFYEKGIGTPKDLSEAIKYYKVCIKNMTLEESSKLKGSI